MDTASNPLSVLDAFDSLDDLISSPARPVAPQPPANYRPAHFDVCRKCKGTKVFTSWAGRIIGPCFACKGEGGKTYKTSAATRAVNRVTSALRKGEQTAQNLVAFRNQYPAIWEWIETSPDFPFALSMREAIAKYGDLTPAQLAACERCVAGRNRAREEKATRIATAPQVNVDRIETALKTALSNGLKRPRLLLDTFKFTLASSTSANAGAIYVKENGEYLGKITDGKFHAVRACDDDRRARVIAVAIDPEKAAVAYGALTGNCSCCGRLLSNAQSVKRGIGPICAAKYGW